MRRQADRRCVLASPLLVLLGAGCAHPTSATKRPVDAHTMSASGKMSVRVASEPAQQLSAAFEFDGSMARGELRFFSPFATRLATLRWTADSAQWDAAGEQRNFASLEEASAQALGVALPLAAMLSWLARQDQAAQGWETDFTNIGSGRIRAQRTQPLPAVDLRIILDPP